MDLAPLAGGAKVTVSTLVMDHYIGSHWLR
jgi:hypothetical protein